MRAREGRVVSINLPVLTGERGEMDIDFSSPEQSLSGGLGSINRLKEVQISLSSDGLLLYVGEASYESGESPLSVWVPRIAVAESARDERIERDESAGMKESPLDTFERSGSGSLS